MAITAQQVKELREKTGAGMMDVKNALAEAEGDATRAEELLRLKGLKSAAKREGRTASAGLVLSDVSEANGAMTGVLVEVNSETDFVAKNDSFIAFSNELLEAAVASGASTVEELNAAPLGDATVADRVAAMIGVIGEKIVVGKVARVNGEHVESYMHFTSPDLPPQVGVLIATDKAGAEVAHDVAVHIAALSPRYLDETEVPEELVENERRIATELTLAEGKPEKAVPMIVEGRLKGFYKQICLVDQAYARDPKVSVGQVLKDAGAKVTSFARIRVGASEE